MWELECEEGWAPKNWCVWTVVLEKTLESPLDCREIQLIHSEGDQPWDFFGRNDAKAETPVLWPPDEKSWLVGKDFDAGRDSGQEEKGTTEDEMAGWHHWLDGHESEWTLGVGDGQGGLVCCNSWGCRVRHHWATELNWTEDKGTPSAAVILIIVMYLHTLDLWISKDNTWGDLWVFEPILLRNYLGPYTLCFGFLDEAQASVLSSRPCNCEEKSSVLDQSLDPNQPWEEFTGKRVLPRMVREDLSFKREGEPS